MSEYESGTFRCKVCAKEYLTKEEGDRHFRGHHLAINKIVIETPRKPGTKHKLTRTMKSKRPDMTPSQDGNPHTRITAVGIPT